MGHPEPLILLPPSEGKATGGGGDPWAADALVAPELDRARAKVMAALRAAMRGTVAQRTKLLGVKGDALRGATEINRLVGTAPTMAAIHRYTGVLYGELAYDDLSTPMQRRVDAQVRVLSGVWGMVSPTDPIPNYKLKMGATLPRVGKLATWWRAGVSAAIDGEAAGRTVWNLLPQEHAAVWVPRADRAAPPSRVITVRFLDEVADPKAAVGPSTKFVAVNHWNKLLKGALVRHILAEQLCDADGLAGFESPHGYVYRPDLTDTRPDGTIIATLVRVSNANLRFLP